MRGLRVSVVRQPPLALTSDIGDVSSVVGLSPFGLSSVSIVAKDEPPQLLGIPKTRVGAGLWPVVPAGCRLGAVVDCTVCEPHPARSTSERYLIDTVIGRLSSCSLSPDGPGMVKMQAEVTFFTILTSASFACIVVTACPCDSVSSAKNDGVYIDSEQRNSFL